ncbi:MAG TPA: hypothetical protein PKC57_12420, partial [Microthrixaceae bacterium]|nr:hypothetical protein [Microthrixaceae bacterium]
GKTPASGVSLPTQHAQAPAADTSATTAADRVSSADETPAETFLTVIRSGDRRRQLEAIRDELASNIALAPPENVAGLTGRLLTVLREIDGLPVEEEESPVDALQKRRAARRAGTDARGRAPGPQPRR